MTRSWPDGAQPSPSHAGPTRQSVLVHYTRLCFEQTSLSETQLAAAVAERYCKTVPEHARGLSLKPLERSMDSDTYLRACDANTKTFQRWMRGDINIPVEVEEAWLDALLEPYRTAARFDLFARLGALPIRIDQIKPLEALADVLKEGADAIHAEAPMLADGKVDEADAEHAPAAIREHLEAASAHLQRAVYIAEKTGTPLDPLLKALA
ncbi:MAG: hypothetical protein ACQES2_00630 [Pseudomonadota bacterium]